MNRVSCDFNARIGSVTGLQVQPPRQERQTAVLQINGQDTPVVTRSSTGIFDETSKTVFIRPGDRLSVRFQED